MNSPLKLYFSVAFDFQAIGMIEKVFLRKKIKPTLQQHVTLKNVK